MNINILKKFSLLFCCICLFYLEAEASVSPNPNKLSKVVSGVVLNAEGEPIISALVSIPGTKVNVVTDCDGQFSLTVPEINKELFVSSVGYASQKVTIESDKKMIVKVLRDAHCQDEQISVSFMRTKDRKSMTSSFSTIKGSELEKYPSSGFSAALVGKLSGLTVLQGGSEPTYDGAGLFVRGRNTINGNSPLLVLDGVPAPTLDLNMIEASTVESVTVLKDAAACALYGFKGGSGVILITTKRGYNGKARVSVSADYSIQTVTQKPDLIHSWEYATLRNQSKINDGLDPAFSESEIEAYWNGKNRELYPDNNWYDYYMKDRASMQRYNLNITGGSDRVKYFVSAGFMDQDALLRVQEKDKYNPERHMQEFNERTNIDINLLPNLSAFLNQSLTVKKNNQAAYGMGDLLDGIFRLPATADGPLTPDNRVVATAWNTNPVYGKINRSGYNKYVETTVNAALGLNWELDFITEGLSLKGVLGYDSRHQGGIFGRTEYARSLRDNSKPNELTFIPFGSWIDSDLALSKGSNYRYFLNFTGSLNYNRTFNDVHEVSALAIYYAEDVVKAGGGVEMIPYSLMSYNIHGKYGYKNKYYLQADMSAMTSDQFRGDNRYGFFPTLSAGWVVSNEDFMKDDITSWLTYLKLRASYGKLGGDQYSGGRYMYKDDIRMYQSGGYINSIYKGAYISEALLGNSKLQWENSYQSNIGISIGLFNAFTLNFDYYYHNQKQVLIKDYQIPEIQGLPSHKSAYQNAGKVRNQGFELELAYDKKIDKNWTVSANTWLALNKNKVLDVHEIDRSLSNSFYPYRKTGYSINQEFGYIIDDSNGNGYFNSEQEIKESGLIYEGVAPRPGDFKYKDLNNDGVINNLDNAPIRYNSLPQISYAATAQVKYKNIDLYVQFQGVAQASRYYSGLGVTEYASEGTYTSLHKKAWTEERYLNHEEIAYPALSTAASSSTQRNSFFIRNQDYLRLKNVEIGYSLSRNLCKKVNLVSARLYLSGSNLLTISDSKFKDLDPESTSLADYPHYKTYNLGLNLTF